MIAVSDHHAILRLVQSGQAASSLSRKTPDEAYAVMLPAVKLAARDSTGILIKIAEKLFKEAKPLLALMVELLCGVCHQATATLAPGCRSPTRAAIRLVLLLGCG